MEHFKVTDLKGHVHAPSGAGTEPRCIREGRAETTDEVCVCVCVNEAVEVGEECVTEGQDSSTWWFLVHSLDKSISMN